MGNWIDGGGERGWPQRRGLVTTGDAILDTPATNSAYRDDQVSTAYCRIIRCELNVEAFAVSYTVHVVYVLATHTHTHTHKLESTCCMLQFAINLLIPVQPHVHGCTNKRLRLKFYSVKNDITSTQAIQLLHRINRLRFSMGHSSI